MKELQNAVQERRMPVHVMWVDVLYSAFRFITVVVKMLRYQREVDMGITVLKEQYTPPKTRTIQ